MYEFKVEDAERFASEQGIRAFRKGKELIFIKCPYCGQLSKDKKKFSIDLESGRFHCFRASCGAKGNMITLAKDFHFSLGRDADEYYRSIRSFRRIADHEKPETKPPAISYMESRGISEKVTREYNITVQKDKENILVFPFYDEDDALQFVKYRKIDYDKTKDSSKEWCEPNCKPILFGMNHVNPDNDTLILTEGMLDSLSVTEAGIENAVSVPTGANGFTWIPYCWDFLHRFKTLIVFGDFEKGHMTLLSDMAVRFNGMVKHVREEDYKGCKDANELLQKRGKDAVVFAVQNAVPVEHPLIKPLVDVRHVDLSKLEKFSTGIDSLDRILGGFYFGQLIILTGERGEGKSTLASQFATFAVREGHNVFCYSGELMNWYFKAWFDGQVVGKSHINKKVSPKGFANYEIDASVLPAMEAWYHDKMYVYDSDVLTEKRDEYALPDVIESAIKQYGCRVLLIDNLMTAMVDDISADQYRQQTIFVNKLSAIAKNYNVAIFLVAHPRKKTGFGFDNDDVAGSSNITNLADVVLRYSKAKGKEKGEDIPKDTPLRDLTVHKNRLSGRTNTVGIRLYYEPESKRISENENDFDWDLGWEEAEFVPVNAWDELPF